MTNVSTSNSRGTYKLVVPADNMRQTAVGVQSVTEYRVYKRRWFGLAQLALLNIIVSWNWLSFAAVSSTSASYFRVSETAINWLSTAFLFTFCFISPVVLWTLNKGGPRPAIIIAGSLTFIGNWIRYAGARAGGGRYGVVMFGQIVIGLAQPFVLTAPTRYSDLWFTAKGRVSATAVASLANPFGGALGQLIGPLWATKESEVPNMVLYIAIVATVVSIPSFFIPAKPPSPPCPSAAEEKVPLRQTATSIITSLEFWLIFISFSVYLGFFNAFSSLINQILGPYGFSETEAGICGALLIVIGLVAAAITSPIFDRHPNANLLAIRIQVPLVALAFLGFIWAPQSRNVAGPYLLASLIGASAFSLMPLALELLVEVSHPISPEITSVVCWTGGQLLGAVFLLIMDALKDGPDAQPPFRMKRALVFEAVLALVVVPLPLSLGLFGRKVRRKRMEADNRVNLP